MMISSSSFLCGLFLVTLGVTSTESATDRKIKFFCVNSYDTKYKLTSIEDADITKKLNFTLNFAFFVHGWQSEFGYDLTDGVEYKIGLAWVKARKTNFCGVDWRELASDGYWDASQKHIKNVGAQLAAFILSLTKFNLIIESTIIAGHSLGAHVAGFAGKAIFDIYEKKISTIFGLDPAGPFFTSLLLFLRSDFVLSKLDATFVQVLHTSSGSYGTSDMIGHSDFIANGGTMQRACLDELITANDLLFKCSHSHAKELFLSSFNHACGGIISHPMNSSSPSKAGIEDLIDEFGINSKRRSGIFTLNTSEETPYCRGILLNILVRNRNSSKIFFL